MVDIEKEYRSKYLRCYYHKYIQDTCSKLHLFLSPFDLNKTKSGTCFLSLSFLNYLGTSCHITLNCFKLKLGLSFRYSKET